MSAKKDNAGEAGTASPDAVDLRNKSTGAPAIFAALVAIQEQIGSAGITKDQRNKHGNYNFRGIDDVLNAMNPILSANNVSIVPKVTSRDVVERVSRNGGAVFYTTVSINYTIYCSSDGSFIESCVYGEAMDSGDKSTNKAMSAAYKYLMFQLFCIPTQASDADSETFEVEPALISAEQEKELTDLLNVKGFLPEDLAMSWGISNIKALHAVNFATAKEAVASW